MRIKPVIIAGGSGTRLWPLSRQLYPKQLIKLFDGLSLLQLTLLRNKDLGDPVVIISEEYRFIAAEQIREIGVNCTLIVEPIQKNTAPCAILGALIAKEEECQIVMLLPADHYIDDNQKYQDLIKRSFEQTEKFGITMLGITPTCPHTGYGYIEARQQIESNIFIGQRFVEKPKKDKATEYLADGNYYWNSGIFIYTPDFMLTTSKQVQPRMTELVQESYKHANKDLDFIRLNKENYAKIDGESVDYAIMEHINNMALLKADLNWSDLGSWDSLWQASKKDTNDNYLDGDVIAEDTTNSYILSKNGLTTVVGLSNVIVVNTGDAVLVADREKSESVKKIVSHLVQSSRKEAIEHTTTFRPWGSYQTVDQGELHKVKRIIVHPGQRLSLQYHHHRAEHWVIVRGIAEVEIGNEIHRLSENDSIYIPKSMKHRLTNIGEIDLQLIEVQTGHYLGEDDIVRLTDIYGRK